MRRLGRRVIPALGLALSNAALGSEFGPPMGTDYLAPSDPIGLRQVARDPLGSRAPAP